MPRKAPRKPPVGNDLMPVPSPRDKFPVKPVTPRAVLQKKAFDARKKALEAKKKKMGAGTGTARRTAPRPTKGYK